MIEKETQIENSRQFDIDTSRSITSLRFLLIVLVVFIHHQVGNLLDITEPNELYKQIPFVASEIIIFITEMLGSCAVPLFFFISGYILVLKNDDYKTFLKKKTKALIVPYFLWPILYVILHSIIRAMPILNSFVNNSENPYLHKSFSEWLEFFFGKLYLMQENTHPDVYQFWYVRDLVLLFLVSPILKKFIEKFPFGFLCFTMIFWLHGTSFHLFISSSGLFFFVFGMFAAKMGFVVNHLEKIQFKEISVLLFITLTANIILSYFGKKGFVISFFTIIGVAIFLFKLANQWQKNEKVFSKLKYLSGFSFWVFAAHAPFLNFLMMKVLKRILPTDGYFILFDFFLIVFLKVLISLGAGILVKKIAPRLFAVLNGGR